MSETSVAAYVELYVGDGFVTNGLPKLPHARGAGARRAVWVCRKGASTSSARTVARASTGSARTDVWLSPNGGGLSPNETNPFALSLSKGQLRNRRSH